MGVEQRSPSTVTIDPDESAGGRHYDLGIAQDRSLSAEAPPATEALTPSPSSMSPHVTAGALIKPCAILPLVTILLTQVGAAIAVTIALCPARNPLRNDLMTLRFRHSMKSYPIYQMTL